jgi:formamidopyrimidine-DNA glycosylase
MPELPEVECVRRSLQRLLVGARVDGVEVRRPDIVARAALDNPAGRARARRVGASKARIPHAELLAGSAVVDILRRGKQLAIVGEGSKAQRPVVMVHLGMSGGFVHAPRARPLPKTDHLHVLWRIARPASADAWTHRLGFRDPRRFGGLTTFPSPEALDAHWALIGPDALTVDGQTLATAADGSRRPIKSLLLDQRVLAGVGNIYADEALFESRLHPRTLARTLDQADTLRLAAAVRRVLAAAVVAGGSTVRSYADADGSPGDAQRGHAVYGRAGAPCVRCGTPLSTAQVGQRTTVWCSNCQPAR